VPQATSQALRLQIEYRISSRISGAANMVPFLNYGLNLIEFASAYTWDMFFATATPGAGTGLITLSTAIDIGKPITFNVASTGQAVTRRRTDQTWPAQPTGTPLSYDSWDLFTGGSAPAIARFLPALNPGILLNQIACLLPTPLDGTAFTVVPWFDPWMDDLYIEIVESELKRILGMAGWEVLQTRCQQKLVEAVKRYGADKENVGVLEWGSRPTEKV